MPSASAFAEFGDTVVVVVEGVAFRCLEVDGVVVVGAAVVGAFVAGTSTVVASMLERSSAAELVDCAA